MSIKLTFDGVQFWDDTVQTTAQYPSFRNKIINGDMMISQRGLSFANVLNGAYTLDRFVYYNTTTSTVTVSQNDDVPANTGLIKSLRVAVTGADADIVATDVSMIGQHIEGYNVSDLVGASFTISFWVRSSKTGIHCLRLRNSSADRCYVTEYTIITANTWEYKTITVIGGLPSTGTWNFTNGTGLLVTWTLAAGSNSQTTPNTWTTVNAISTANQVNCLDTLGNIFAITGVQLEKSPVATPYEERDTNVALQLCQRYYSGCAANIRMWASAAGQTFIQPLLWPSVMRDVPVVTFVAAANDTGFTAKTAVGITTYGAGIQLTTTAAGNVCYSLYGEAFANAEL